MRHRFSYEHECGVFSDHSLNLVFLQYQMLPNSYLQRKYVYSPTVIHAANKKDRQPMHGIKK